MKDLLPLLLFSFLFITCKSTEKIKDIVIIGGGLMGSTTAWQLSNYGEEILLIEQQDSVYSYGSSFGEARIARSSNRGNDIWSYLHNRSVKEANKLVAYLDSNPQGNQTYDITDIYTTSPVTYIGRTRIYDKLYNSLIRQKVDYKIAVNQAEGKELFDVNLPDSVLMQVEYNEHSGNINPQKIINYCQQAVLQKGNTIWYNHKVTDLTQEGDIYVIQLVNTKTGNKKTIKSKKIVSAAGPFTGKLLKNIAPYFDQLINPQRVFLAFFKINKAHFENYSPEQKEKIFTAYPVINSSKGTRDGSFFSMIEKVDEYGFPLIKIGGHFQRSPIRDLSTIWQQKLTKKEIEWSQNSTLGYFELLDVPLTLDQLELVDSYSCVYSLTKTEVPYVTHIPISNSKISNPNLVVLGGMSGVGAKGALTYGLLGANLLLEKTDKEAGYQEVKAALGFERLLKDLEEME